jgi:hypothetical protein
MRIALLISGRLKCYETCLLPLLQNSSYDVDVFASINDVDYDYYNRVITNLSPWLKGLYISIFSRFF